MDALVIDSMDYSQRRSHQGGKTGEPPTVVLCTSRVLVRCPEKRKEKISPRLLPGVSQH